MLNVCDVQYLPTVAVVTKLLCFLYKQRLDSFISIFFSIFNSLQTVTQFKNMTNGTKLLIIQCEVEDYCTVNPCLMFAYSFISKIKYQV
jgi:hypothetical protein